MRWFTIAVCACLGIVAQTTLAETVSILHVRPDWMFVLVVFFALYLPSRDALMSAWILGLLVDLASLERVGLMAMAYLLTAAAVHASRESVFLRKAMTHGAVTLAGGLLLQIMLASFRAVAYPDTAWSTVMIEGVAAALYTAVWAVPIHGALLRCSPLFGLKTPRRSGGRGLAVGAGHV